MFMGSSPKKQDYQASASEKASASVALQQYQKFKRLYDPLLQNMRDESKSEDSTNKLRGRANADTMQALTSAPSYANTQVSDIASDQSKALQGQLGLASASGKNIQNQMKTNVVGIASEQAADAQSGMAQASRLATSDALTRAQAKQTKRSARNSALGEIAGATMVLGAKKGAFGDGKFSEFINTMYGANQLGRV
jgi:hypothetical protein